MAEGGFGTAVPHGPHGLKEPRGIVASGSVFQLPATSARMGASFEAASRRLETRGGWELLCDRFRRPTP
jgi:hypothetical protein